MKKLIVNHIAMKILKKENKIIFQHPMRLIIIIIVKKLIMKN